MIQCVTVVDPSNYRRPCRLGRSHSKNWIKLAILKVYHQGDGHGHSQITTGLVTFPVRQIHILEVPRDAEAGGEMMPLARLLASALPSLL